MTDFIIVKTSMPDDASLYSWTTISHYQNDLGTGYKNEPIYFLESDFETNTIRIIELKNVLNRYDKLIEFLEKTSQIITEPIEEFKKIPKKIYINSGTYEARRRFKDAVKGKNEIYINNLLQQQNHLKLVRKR